MIKELNCSCICREDIIVAVVDQVKEPNSLVVALIIIVCIVIVGILIIGFNKLKEPPEEESERQTYY